MLSPEDYLHSICFHELKAISVLSIQWALDYIYVFLQQQLVAGMRVKTASGAIQRMPRLVLPELWKSRGNAFVGAGDYQSAAQWYGKGIEIVRREVTEEVARREKKKGGDVDPEESGTLRKLLGFFCVPGSLGPADSAAPGAVSEHKPEPEVPIRKVAPGSSKTDSKESQSGSSSNKSVAAGDDGSGVGANQDAGGRVHPMKPPGVPEGEAPSPNQAILSTLYSNRSLCHGKLQEWESALEDAHQAVRWNPRFPRAYLRKVGLYFIATEYTLASTKFANLDAFSGLHSESDNLIC